MQTLITRRRTRSFLLSCIVVCVSVVIASSQAPEDGDTTCRDLPSHPKYASHIRPLMDTRDYIQLLPSSDGTGGVWNTVPDRDSSGWSEVGASCNRLLYLCMEGTDSREKWLLTQYISRKKSITLTYTDIWVMFNIANLDSTDLPSTSFVSLYIIETSSQNVAMAYNQTKYQFVANVRPDSTQIIRINTSMEYSGFYLGIVANGVCVQINRLLVYAYAMCEATTVSLIQVGTAVFNGSASVQGKCVANSTPKNGDRPHLECMETEEWRVVVGCQCLTDYYMDNAGKQCIQSPSAPLNVSVVEVTDTTVSLSWIPPTTPQNSSGVHYTVSFSALPHHMAEDITDLIATEIKLTGLIPFLLYDISVTAENEVSYQDSDTGGRTVSVNVSTLEGVAAKVTDIEVYKGADILISWLEPNPPHGHILHYNIKIIESNKITTQLNYTSTYITLETWKNDWKITSDNVKIQIQAVTSIGGGEFSEPKDVSTTSSTSEDMESSSKVTTQIVIGVITAVIVVLLVTVLVIFQYTSRKRKALTSARNDIEEYASIKLSPTDTNFSISPPALPRSPRPPKPESSSDGLNDGRTYAVLEGPTQGADGNKYSLDPSGSGAHTAFGVPSLAPPPGDYTDECSTRDGGAFVKPSPVYFELENPLQSSFIKHRANRNANPLSQPVLTSSGVCWNEGLGPLKSKDDDPDQQDPATRVQANCQHAFATVMPAGGTPEPAYSEISTTCTKN